MGPKSRRSAATHLKVTKPGSKQVRLTDAFKQSKRGVVRSEEPTKNGKSSKNTIESLEPVFDLVEDAKDLRETAEKPRVHLDCNDEEFVRYIQDIESADIAQQIHAENLTAVDKILRRFDLTEDYGPTVGMTRLERWNRANKLGLSPPSIVYRILTSLEGTEQEGLRESYLYKQI
ncbi:DNA polymerase delta, subunit 4 [Dipodascopsis uninucleata]